MMIARPINLGDDNSNASAWCSVRAAKFDSRLNAQSVGKDAEQPVTIAVSRMSFSFASRSSIRPITLLTDASFSKRSIDEQISIFVKLKIRRKFIVFMVSSHRRLRAPTCVGRRR